MKSFSSAGLEYMLTGALAASYYGTPRTTMDVDVVIRFSSKDRTCNKLLYALKEAGVQAERRKIEAAFESGFKIATFRDSRSPFTLDTIFSEKKLEKRSGTILGLPTYYQSPEALILAKLRMIKATVSKERSLKDEEDVVAILTFTEVDVKTLKRKAREESTVSILEGILAKKG